MDTESTKTLRQRAEESFADRLAALEPLEAILDRRLDLKRQLAATDGPYGEAYAAAEKAGWTEDQLAELGAESPVVRPSRPRGRPRKSAARPPVQRGPESTVGNAGAKAGGPAEPAPEGSGGLGAGA